MGAREQNLSETAATDAGIAPTQRGHALLVAGMHRTGTSAITRALSLLGIDLPHHLAPGLPNNNDLGFWESVPIAEAHDRFLASIDSAWDDVSPIAPSVFRSVKADAFIRELVDLIRAEYGDSSLFVVKDPRLCRLIPLWIAALEQLGVRPSFVVTTRNPLEVAASLNARDGFGATKSYLLWLRHLLDAERDSRGFPRVFVSYEGFLRDWPATEERMAQELHLFWPRSSHETHRQIEEYLSSSLRHHSFDYSDLRARKDVADWVKRAFDGVTRATTDVDDLDSGLFDEIRAQLDRADHAYGPLLAQARARVDEVDAARAETESQLAAVGTQLAEQQAELASLNTDNQRVTALLVEEIETVAALERVLAGVANAVARLGDGLGDIGAELQTTERQPAMLRTAAHPLLEQLRQRPTAAEEPDSLRHALNYVIDRTYALLALLDNDRTYLFAALAEREAEARSAAETLVASERKLADAQQDLQIAEATAIAQTEALRAAIEERDDNTRARERLTAALNDRGEEFAERVAAYEDLRREAQQLASAVAETEAALMDARRALDSVETDVAQLRESLAESELEHADALARLELVELEANARESNLQGTLARLKEELSGALARTHSAEAERHSATSELAQVVSERDALRDEVERVLVALTKRSTELAGLRQTNAAQQAELAETRLRIEEISGDADAAAGEFRAALTEREERLAGTLEDARQLATALAEREDALSERAAELRDRDRQIRVAMSELAARDELLASRDERIDAVSTELQLRNETLAMQSELLAQLDAIGRGRSRRWRSFTQFCSWLFPPSAEHLGYIQTFLRMRHSKHFDPDFYLSQYPDVSHTGLNPLMHYIEHGLREGRQPVGTPEPPSVSALPLPIPVAALTAASATMPREPGGAGDEGDTAVEEDDYATRLHAALAKHLPGGAMVAVATAGDEIERWLANYRTCHFPQALDGSCEGNAARGDTALIAGLEAMRAGGAEFLYVSANQRSVVERNPRFRAHLYSRYSSVLDSEELGLCFALYKPAANRGWRQELAELAEWIESEAGREASILDWGSELRLGELGGINVSTFLEPELPHLDRSIDVVAVGSPSEERLAEAARVARHAVLEVPSGDSPRLITLVSSAEPASSVSIVIPCHEQFVHTQTCLRALEETLPTWFSGEVIIVDDASSSGTAADLQQLADSTPRVRLLRNEVNRGFLASVNRAVQEADREFVVLLNNDTIPLPGWLPPLLGHLHTRDDVGAVGGRLVYPDGRLQEAGGLVFRDGSAAKFGYGDPEPDFPLFTVPREVDYCSGCLLAFRRDLFLESGGFDPMYGFGFYEDTDFCFRLRALGRVVLYEPESVVVHVEGASAGTDLTQGAKRFQALNASLFTERWREALEHQHERPRELNRRALQSLARRIGTP